MRNRTFWIGLSLITFMVLAALVSLNFPATAQGEITPKTATPQPSPTGNGGNATWTVKSRAFKSNYPKGFEFDLDVTSTGGKIVEASVVWSHNPSTRARRAGVIDPAQGAIKAVWNRTTESIPQWVGVDYFWQLKDAVGNLYQTETKYEEYADNTRKWSRAESDDVIVFWQSEIPARIGQMTINAMKERRPFYARAWGELLPYKPRVLIYLGYEAPSEWDPAVGTIASSGGSTTRVAGKTSRDWGGTAQFYLPEWGDTLESVAYGTVLHEVGHLYQYESGGIGGDTWFIEGDAEYFSLDGMDLVLARARRIAASGDMPTLQDGGPSARGAFARQAYDIGYAFWIWIEKTYGVEAHLRIWQMRQQGRTTNDALRTVTGMNFVAMETAFRNWLGAPNAAPPTPFPTLTPFFLPSPTPEPTPG